MKNQATKDRIKTSVGSRTARRSVRYIAVIAMFSALAFLLMFIEVSIPIVPEFLKFDISELPALLISFMYGPLSGVLVCGIKNLLHLTVTHTGGVGELSNFILGAVFCLCAGYLYRLRKTKGGAIISMLIASACMAFVCFFTNLYIVYPFYYHFMPKEAILGLCRAILPSVDSIEKSLIVFNIPFTFFKGVACSILTFLLYKRMKKILGIQSE